MKGIELLNEIVNNNMRYLDKEFTSENFGTINIKKSEDENLYICFENNDFDNDVWNTLKHFSLEEFVEVKKPVKFEDAMKTLKKVRVEHALLDKIYKVCNNQVSFNRIHNIILANKNSYQYLEDILQALLQCVSRSELRQILLEGNWYIEED